MLKLTKTLSKWLIALTAISTVLVGCNKDLKDDINELKDRVNSLEVVTSQLESAINSGKLISSVTPISKDGQTGYEIKFSGNSSDFITIWNGIKGDQGNDGNNGSDGVDGNSGQTPYIWINDSGNWAMNWDEKPVDSNNSKYEILDGSGNPISSKGNDGKDGANGNDGKDGANGNDGKDGANGNDGKDGANGNDGADGNHGNSIQVVNENGYIAFVIYNPNKEANEEGYIIEKVITNFPFNGGMIITSIVETNNEVKFTIDGNDYILAKAIVYPTSITVMTQTTDVAKYLSTSFEVVVNPTNAQIDLKNDFSLIYEPNYKVKSVGDKPEFIDIESVEEVAGKPGRYNITVKWTNDFTGDKAIFVVLSYKYTNVSGSETLAQVVSSTPIFFTESFMRLTDDKVLDQTTQRVIFFIDETYTSSIQLADGYPAAYIASNYPKFDSDGVDPSRPSHKSVLFSKDLNDRFIFNVKANPSCDFIHNQVPGFYALDVTSHVTLVDTQYDETVSLTEGKVTKDFNVRIFKHKNSTNLAVYNHLQRWLPNENTTYTIESDNTLAATMVTYGYSPDEWDFEVISNKVIIDNNPEVDLPSSIVFNNTLFNAPNYTISYTLGNTIEAGYYSLITMVKATAKAERGFGLPQERSFMVVNNVEIVAPIFAIATLDNTLTSNIYQTNKWLNVSVAQDLFDINSTRFMSASNQITPAAPTLAYKYTTEAQGAQGVIFSSFPNVTRPDAVTINPKADINLEVYVKLSTGQKIPVTIVAGNNFESGLVLNNNGEFIVRYIQSPVSYVKANITQFNESYETLINNPINISSNNNFSPMDKTDAILDPSLIALVDGIVYELDGDIFAVNPANVDTNFPDGIDAKTQLFIIDSKTGAVSSNPLYTWSTTDNVIICQNCKVTYTDIWGNKASKTVLLRVMSNAVPSPVQP